MESKREGGGKEGGRDREKERVGGDSGRQRGEEERPREKGNRLARVPRGSVRARVCAYASVEGLWAGGDAH